MSLVKQTPNSNELYLYDGIGVFGITASDVAQELTAIDPTKPLDVYINSIGGSVYDGLAIYNMLSRYQGKVTTHTDGISASIASLIFMAGDERLVSKGGGVMIHAPSLVVMGNLNDLNDAVSYLEGAQQRVIDVYADATGQPASYFEAILASGKDKWYDETEAIEAKLATKKKNTPAMKATIDSVLYNMDGIPDWLQVEETQPTAIRAAEKALRTQAGLSRQGAKAVLSDGWKALAQKQDSERDAHANRLLKALTS
jgi:ATP-dependent protease ClpP protease subunit